MSLKGFFVIHMPPQGSITNRQTHKRMPSFSLTWESGCTLQGAQSGRGHQSWSETWNMKKYTDQPMVNITKTWRQYDVPEGVPITISLSQGLAAYWLLITRVRISRNGLKDPDYFRRKSHFYSTSYQWRYSLLQSAMLPGLRQNLWRIFSNSQPTRHAQLQKANSKDSTTPLQLWPIA